MSIQIMYQSQFHTPKKVAEQVIAKSADNEIEASTLVKRLKKQLNFTKSDAFKEDPHLLPYSLTFLEKSIKMHLKPLIKLENSYLKRNSITRNSKMPPIQLMGITMRKKESLSI